VDPVKPKEPTNPDWTPANYAENQPEYHPLPSIRNTTRQEVPVISAWRLTEEEIAYIRACEEAGEPVTLYHEQWVFKDKMQQPAPLQPIRMWLGEVQMEGGPWTPPAPPTPQS
jgi:hypothetical protein